MEVFWHHKAYTSLDKNIDYLKKEWTQNEVAQFLDKVEVAIELVLKNNELGVIFEDIPTLRKILITKEIYMFYEVDNERLYIVLFWNNYQNPDNLQMLFS